MAEARPVKLEQRWSEADYRAVGLLPSRTSVSIPGELQCLADILIKPLREKPEAEALVGRDARYSFRELEAEVAAATHGLLEMGLRPGDRIAACCRNHVDLVVAFLAAQRLSLIWVGLNPALTAFERANLLDHAGVSVLLADNGTDELHAELARRGQRPPLIVGIGLDPQWRELIARHHGRQAIALSVDPFAPAMISYTSGTTGSPKGVVHSQRNAALIAAAGVARGQWDIALRRGVCQPLSINNMVIRFVTPTLFAGGTFICMDRMDTRGIVEWIQNERIQTYSVVPTMVHDLLRDPGIDDTELATLIRPVVGGAGLPDGLRVAYRKRFGVELQFGYGLTEGPTGVAQTDPEKPWIPGSSGRALPHLEIAILDEHGERLSPGVEGEVCVGPKTEGPWNDVYTPALGYWRNAEASRALVGDGWLHTGDVGHLRADGELYVRGRLSEMINRGGANIYPAELEATIALAPGVRDCAVVGRPDERLGEKVAAVVEPDAPLEIDADTVRNLYRHCLASHAQYQVPGEWHFIEAMPRNAMRKIVRPAVKALVAEGSLKAFTCRKTPEGMVDVREL